MNLTCPYCEHSFRYRHDGEEAGERYEEECPKCSKIFAYEIEFEILTTAFKADCLNGGEHEWKISACYPEFMTQRYCACGKSEYVYSDQERKEMSKKYLKELEQKK
jgi:hypothetical protein